VDASVNYAVKRLRTSIATLTRKTTKACHEGIIDTLDSTLTADADAEAAADGGAVRLFNAADPSRLKPPGFNP
jgi:hypothetical protein